MALTVIAGTLNILVVLGIGIVPLPVSIIYQLTRTKWQVQSIGEIVVGNDSKNDLLLQTSTFSVTRIPIFLLLIFILIINAHLLDGLVYGFSYRVADLILFVIFFTTIYYGVKNFFIKPSALPVLMFSAGQLLIAFAFKKDRFLDFRIYDIYWWVALLWLAIGTIYKWKSFNPKPDSSANQRIAG